MPQGRGARSGESARGVVEARVANTGWRVLNQVSGLHYDSEQTTESEAGADRRVAGVAEQRATCREAGQRMGSMARAHLKEHRY